jgi:hypothetical protein
MSKRNPVVRFMERLFPKKFTRRYERHNITLDGVLVSTQRMVRINGRMLDVSQGGGLFRPGTRYLMDRAGEDAMLLIAGLEIPCAITRSWEKGYSLMFRDELTSADISRIREDAGAQARTAEAEKARSEHAASAA